MLARIRKAQEKESGFTLIELLVVIIIIGILAAVAIPVFLNQRKKAVDSAIKSDLKSVANALEDYAVDNPTTPYLYGAVPSNATAALNAKTTTGNNILISGTVTTGYCIRGFNPNGNANAAANAYWYDSALGGLQAARGAAPAGGVCA